MQNLGRVARLAGFLFHFAFFILQFAFFIEPVSI